MRDFCARPASAASASRPAVTRNKPAWNAGIGGRTVSPVKPMIKSLQNVSRYLPSPSKAPASLTNLKDVLARLAMPPPSRSNTSLGVRESTQDDIRMNRDRVKAKPLGNLGRSVTLGADAFSTRPSDNKVTLMPGIAKSPQLSTLDNEAARNSLRQDTAGIPLMPISPFVPPTPLGTDYVVAVTMDAEEVADVKRKGKTRASNLLSLDTTNVSGVLATPLSFGIGPSPIPSVAKNIDSSGLASSSVRSAPGAIERIRAASRSYAESEGTESLQFLKNCVVYVDVRTEGGEDAGGLFVDMLKEMGAKV